MTAEAAPGSAAIESVVLVREPAPALVVVGSGAVPSSIELAGPRLRLPAELTAGPPGRGNAGGAGGEEGWKATIPLLAGRWGGPELPPPSGSYLLHRADAPAPEP